MALLGAPAVATLAAAGLEPAGDVIGCIVMHLAWSSMNCGGYRAAGNRNLITPVLKGGRDNPYLKARYHAYDTALSRLLAEAEVLGADGVVGVTLTWTTLDSGAHELMALGTAVRERDPQRRRTSQSGRTGRTEPACTEPFCTELSGQDTAKLLLAGWRPLGIAIGLATTVKHKDASMEWQMSNNPLTGNAGNTEVAGLTKLITVAREDARYRMAERADAFPGAAHVVISRAEVSSGHRRGQPRHDVVAEATFVGTALGRDPGARRHPLSSSLSILPLRDR